jgi:hypothetical protein
VRLVGEIVCHLENRRIPCALIGGGALAMHGVARATLGLDLLVVDRGVLEPSFWDQWDRCAAPLIVEGPPDDPLAGVLHFGVLDSFVDLFVGKDEWMKSVLDRRIWVTVSNERIPIVDAADLVLTKIAAGGPQDLLDIQILLAGRERVQEDIEGRIGSLPPDLQKVWRALSL